jgi:hypothetical protein
MTQSIAIVVQIQNQVAGHVESPGRVFGPGKKALLAGFIAALGFASLLVIAPYVGGDVDIMGLSDSAAHNIAHVTVYGGLALLVAFALRGRLIASWLITNLLAGGEEWHQQFVPGRVMGWDDMLLNTIGITVALALLLVALRVRRWKATASVNRQEIPVG